MKAVITPTFEEDAAKYIYEHVERHGSATRRTLRNVVPLTPREFRVYLDELIARGYLEETDGTIELAFNFGSDTEYDSAGVSCTIRPGQPEDFERLVDTIRNVTADKSYVVAESVAEKLLYEDTITRHNPVESRVFFVASTEGDIAGWTHLDMPQLEQLKDSARQTVGVRDAYRGEGIGSELLKRGIDWAEANGFRKVYNNIPATNEASMEFLQQHGWDTEAIRQDHYTIDGDPVDEVMMSYTF
jgi:L-amino acid N-acyltransferase YncA